MSVRRFAVLDRDGTIIVQRHYLSDPAQVELLPGAAQGLRAMRALGLGLVVITNQSAVGRGYFKPHRLDEIHQRMNMLLAAEDLVLDGIYVCPHTPEDGCDCRKPQPALLVQAARELDFEPRAAFVIGDKPCDIELGRRCGATTFLVRTGYGAEFAADPQLAADYIAADLTETATVIERLLASSHRRALAG